MGDDELISRVAVMWVDGGGDAEGISWCWLKLAQAVAKELERRKVEAENEDEESMRDL